MPNKKYLLKPNIIAEPLINNWYAWVNLISPLTYSKYLRQHVKLLKSYVQAPHIHKQANKEIRLRGGSFLDLDNKAQSDDVINLLEYTKDRCAELIALAASIDLLNENITKNSVQGLSLENFYVDLPHDLRGLVELVYDLNNYPSTRFIEPLFYNSDYYIPELQTVLLYQKNPDERAFVLSTPRFVNENAIQVSLPFCSPFYDDLFKSRESLLSIQEIKHLYAQYLSDSEISFERFMDLFYMPDDSPASLPNAKNETIVKYFGHACVMLQSPDCTVLIDPLVAYENQQSSLNRFSFSDLPSQIDYVILTHSHQDHAVIETMLQIRYKIKNIVVPQNNKGSIQDPSLKLALQQCGFENIFEISELDEIIFKNGKILALPFLGEHADLDIRSKLGYVVTLREKSVLFLADSKNLDPSLYSRLAKIIPSLDIIFIGLESEGAPLSWLYGPLMPNPVSKAINCSRRLSGSNAKEGFDIIRTLGCRRVFVYAMAYEPWLTFISNLDYETSTKQINEAHKLISYCEEIGVKSELLYGSKLIAF